MNEKKQKTWKFPWTFWAANSLELFERWAYYGVFNLLAIYLTNPADTGALGFSQVEKGLIMGIVNAILYFLPVVTGSLADRFGYKRTLLVSFLILSSGYYLMGMVSSFAMVFLAFFYVAIGAALFKPIISATVAKTTHAGNSTIGFGIFYMMINIGGMVGPLVASELREMHWNYVFMMSSGAILLNLIIVLFFYKEPDAAPERTSLAKELGQAFRNIFEALRDRKFLVFLLIIVGSWTVYWQYFYSLPVFIEQWGDTGVIFQGLASVSETLARVIGTSEGIILTEKIITLDAIFIVLFQVTISRLFSRRPPLATMAAGMLINTLGISLAFITRNGWFIVGSIFIFSIVEMMFSPKILEYIGRIAPRDRAALYMGAQFLPIAMGNFLAGILSGEVYETLADKTRLLTKLLTEKGITVAEGSSLPDLMDRACGHFGTDTAGIDRMLWEDSHPWRFMLVLAGLGLLTVILLWTYDRKLRKEQKE